MITLDHLTFSYSKKALWPAVDDVSARLPEGITLLLGENGAGKTTLLRLLAGRLIAQSGTIDIDGAGSPATRRPSVTGRIFFLPDDLSIPRRSIREYAESFETLYPRFSVEMFRDNLTDFSLSGNEKFESLSLGNRHKSLLAFALATGVDLLLFDEPANGLDITSKTALRRMLARCVEPSQTVIVSTHTVSDLHELYDGLIVMSKARLLMASSAGEIAGALRFSITDIPPRDALYFEQRAGRFHSIAARGADDEAGAEIDFPLLYSALLSDARSNILSQLPQ